MSDLVVVSLEAWDAVWRRNQHLIDGLLGRDPDLRVLFVEPPVDPVHALRRGRRPERGRGLRLAPPTAGYGKRLWLLGPTKWLPRRADPGCDRRWARGVEQAMRRLGMTGAPLWVNDPLGAELLQRIHVPALYDVTDDWTVADREAAELARTVRQEQFLLSACREVVVCSATLARTKQTPRPMTVVPNGVDLAAYRSEHPRPASLPTGPVALYVGTLHRDRLDVDLAVQTARAVQSHGHVVLAGPIALADADADALRRAGAILLGAQDRSEVPALLQHADVLVVPHVVTAFTESLDPIKLYEYAAAGRPVISTPVAGFRDDTSGRVTLASGADFAGTVAAGLVAPRVPSVHLPEDDRADWANRVEQVAAVLDRARTP